MCIDHKIYFLISNNLGIRKLGFVIIAHLVSLSNSMVDLLLLFLTKKRYKQILIILELKIMAVANN